MTRSRDESALRGRGASWNPANRFGGQDYALDPDGMGEDEDAPNPATIYIEDCSKSILAENESPDIPFRLSVNPYRGCEHGCVYCYARPFHEYLGFSAGLEFETKILVKHRAPELLRAALESRSYQPQSITFSGVTDCYQPAERKFQITRQCLQVLAEYRNPVAIITKNRLVTRDIDILSGMTRYNGAMVFVSLTTLDLGLNRILEPRSSSPAQRRAAIRALSEAGIPVGVMTAPVVPGITDHEIPALLAAARAAGASHAGYITLRLPHAVAPLFEHWLGQHFPDRKEKVLHRIRELRDGKLNDPSFGSRMRGGGPWAEQFSQFFRIAARKNGLDGPFPRQSTAEFRRSGPEQMALF